MNAMVSAVGAAERLRADVEQLASGPRHRAVPGSMDRARGHCVEVFQQEGWQVTQLPFRSRPALLRTSDFGRAWWPLGAGGPIEGINLVAHRGDPHGAVWVLAHLDSVYASPGADDNASGVAGVLELARRDVGPDVALVLTDNEEAGVMGSYYLARGDLRPRLVINLESIGFFREEPGTQRLPPELSLTHRQAVDKMRQDGMRGDFLLGVHRPTSAAAAQAWERHARSAGLRTMLLEDRRWNGRGQVVTARANPLGMNLDRSDHARFWRMQIPAMMITDTAPLRNRAYHHAGDTPDTLDYERMAQLVDAISATLPELRC